ncbi:MAG: PrsW family glutamic-type intramembrane protease [Minisyncoccia bacterium]
MAYSLVLAIFLAYLPIYFWLKFFLKWDKEKPEPFKWLLLIFFLGILCTPLIYHLQSFFHFSYFNQNLNLFFVSLIEEIFKLLIPFLVLKKNKYFDEAFDGIIYLIVFGLGLAFIENIGITIEELVSNHSFSNVFLYLFLRFLGANLLHALTGGLLGYFFALYLIKKKASFLFLGLIFSSLAHWFFNFLMINFSLTTFIIGLAFFGVIMSLLFKFGQILKSIKKPIQYPF